MKKVIFISALAIAAAVSCTKSDIVDTKFNEEISFQSYVGRDAMTKAAVATVDNIKSVEVYGYYLGSNPTWGEDSKANLWNPLTLAVASSGAGTVPEDQKKYWANDADNYTFLAYAPKADGTVLKADEAKEADADGQNVVLTYKVPQTPLSDQHDLLYAKTEGTAADLKSGVVLNMQHALARLTVKAARAANAPAAFNFDVKEVSISGPFKTEGTFNLYNGAWDSNTGTGSTEYVFHRNGTATTVDGVTTVTYNEYNENNVLSTTAKDYAYYAESTKSEVANNYLMMIPTTFATNNATLKVVYTTYYEDQESQEIEKTFSINQEFKQGCAYAISLEFTHETTEISFRVEVEDWKNEAGAEADPDNETDVTETPVTPAA